MMLCADVVCDVAVDLSALSWEQIDFRDVAGLGSSENAHLLTFDPLTNSPTKKMAGRTTRNA